MFGPAVAEHARLWLVLHRTYALILGTEPLYWRDMDTAREQASISLALDTVWGQWQGQGMLTRKPDDFTRMHGFGPLLGGDEPITTLLLFECAGLLDEHYHFRGPYPRMMDRSLSRMWEINLRGEYGAPYRLAEKLAGRRLSHSDVLALIDFALNPPLPGLHSDLDTIDWRELYPPYRFMFAAITLRERRTYEHSEQESVRPTPQQVTDFFSAITRHTDIRVGSIDSNLSADSTLRDTASPGRHFAERIARMTLLFSSLLNRERVRDVRSISHFGSLMVDPDGVRLLDSEADDHPWWFFAPLRVVDSGVLAWPKSKLTMDEATDLFIGAAIASAYDDIVSGVGPLELDHLPAQTFMDPDETEALNSVIKQFLGLNIGWPTQR
ncbi:hypothetical protein ACFZBU_04140 [Embleya sp. NPDC008237]|uniref:hypothetical protein n=1 Tax=Embleya sp. NPDC008237 TaxID=3363978 RepID=UPI0036EB6E4C